MTRLMITAALVLIPTLGQASEIGTAVTTLMEGELTQTMADTAMQDCAGAPWMAVAELGPDGSIQASSVEIVCIGDA